MHLHPTGAIKKKKTSTALPGCEAAYNSRRDAPSQRSPEQEGAEYGASEGALARPQQHSADALFCKYKEQNFDSIHQPSSGVILTSLGSQQ
jgi:hypothetical protein